MGDDHHSQGIVSHCWGFDGEALHSQGCLEITKFHFDLPTFDVEVGNFFSGVFDGVKKVGNNDESRFFARSIFIAQFDVTQGESVGQSFPFFDG